MTVIRPRMDLKEIYSSLDPALREIRVLRLLPGSWEEPIDCQLQVVSLNDQPEYETLSYAWGKTGVFKTVQLHGTPFSVTANLWCALRRLRRRQHERVIWTDGTCINQEDLEEKSQQVALMGEIYSRASHGFIWLGDSISKEESVHEPSPGAVEDGKDIKWISENIGQIFEQPNLPATHENEALRAFGILFLLSVDEHWTAKPVFATCNEGRYHVAERYAGPWQATLKLLRLSWWTRIWVVQELVLAKNATLVVGSTSVP